MIKFFAVILSVVLFNPFAAHAMGERPRSKPQSPLSVQIVPANNSISAEVISAGDIVDLIVIVKSQTGLEAVKVNLVISGRVELLKGEIEWSGPVEEGGEITLPITVRMPDKGQGKIKAKATANISKGTSFSAVDTFISGPSSNKKIDEPRVEKDGRGRDIIEHRL